MAGLITCMPLASCDHDTEPDPDPASDVDVDTVGRKRTVLTECNDLIIKYNADGTVSKVGRLGSLFVDEFTYTANRIVYEYGDPTNHTFMLNNGLINLRYAPGSEDAAYKYDTAGQLIEVLVYEDYERDKTVCDRIEYTWENGCITEVYDSYNGNTSNYFYLDYEDKNMINDDCIKYINALTLGEYFYFTEEFLYATGYFGKIPNKLITKISNRGTSAEDFSIEILSVDNNGCPTSIKLYRPDYAMSGIYKLNWQQI